MGRELFKSRVSLTGRYSEIDKALFGIVEHRRLPVQGARQRIEIGFELVLLLGGCAGLDGKIAVVRGDLPESPFLFRKSRCRLSGLRLAFSQGLEPCYVQDRLREDAQQLSLLLQQGAQVLVCGSREMAAGVRAVIEPMLQSLGESLEQLRVQGRYREDVY